MTFVIGEACIKCKLTDCVEVCPVDCFYEGPNMLVIHPDECIDCALCEPECPVDAIYSEDELPEDQEEFLDLNAELADSLAEHHGSEGRATRRGRVARGREQARTARALIPAKPRGDPDRKAKPPYDVTSGSTSRGSRYSRR